MQQALVIIGLLEEFDPPYLHHLNGRESGRFCFRGQVCCRVAACRIDNPGKSYIDVVKTEKRRRFLIGPKVKVLDIGSPSWKKEVPRSATWREAPLGRPQAARG